LQSLADIGYDSTTIAPLPYDWRLPLGVMEARDAWFSRAVAEIELQASVTGERCVCVRVWLWLPHCVCLCVQDGRGVGCAAG
jgi:hypothetical protein